MDPLTISALISGGAALGSSALSSFGQAGANQANLQVAREQMAFQERMSSTAHQREVKDLRAAGLNPILSANSGASVGPGAGIAQQNTLRGFESSASAIADIALKRELAKTEQTKQEFNKVASSTQLTQQAVNSANAVILRENAVQALNDAAVERESGPALARIRKWASAFGNIVRGSARLN